MVLLSALCVVAAGGLLMEASAFACIPIAVLQLTPSEVAPGGTVTALLRQISGHQLPPVTFHLNSIDGPVLATAQPTDSDTSATFQIPASTPGGDYLVIATQPLETFAKGQFPTWGMPAKAVLHVDTPHGSPPIYAGSAAIATQNRPSGLVQNQQSRLSGTTIALIVVGTMIVSLAVIVGVSTVVRRPSPAITGDQ